MDKDLIKQIKKKLKYDKQVMQHLHNSDLNDNLIYTAIIRRASVHALDILAAEIVKPGNASFAAEITGTSGLEYTRAALDEIRKELNI